LAEYLFSGFRAARQRSRQVRSRLFGRAGRHQEFSPSPPTRGTPRLSRTARSNRSRPSPGATLQEVFMFRQHYVLCALLGL